MQTIPKKNVHVLLFRVTQQTFINYNHDATLFGLILCNPTDFLSLLVWVKGEKSWKSIVGGLINKTNITTQSREKYYTVIYLIVY